jgi:hypothetical protein
MKNTVTQKNGDDDDDIGDYAGGVHKDSSSGWLWCSNGDASGEESYCKSAGDGTVGVNDGGC